MEDTPENTMAFVYARLFLIAAAFLHSLTWLSSYWSPHLKARIQYFSGGSKVTLERIKTYSYVKAHHHKPSGSYCDIKKIEITDGVAHFHFMENKYLLDESK